jgi:FMN phosphatase YigB (HAD superfamily)
MIKAIFFDWGDTLATIDYHSANMSKKLNDILAPYNLNWERFYPYWKNFYLLRSTGAIKSDEEVFLQINRVLQKEIPLQKIRDARINNHFVSKENIEVIKKLKENYKVGVLSNGVKDWIEELKNFGIKVL